MELDIGKLKVDRNLVEHDISEAESQLSSLDTKAQDKIRSIEDKYQNDISQEESKANQNILDITKHISELESQQMGIDEFITNSLNGISSVVKFRRLSNQQIAEYRKKLLTQLSDDVKNVSRQLLTALRETTNLIEQYRIPKDLLFQDNYVECLIPVWYIMFTEPRSRYPKWLVYTPSSIHIEKLGKKQSFILTQFPVISNIYAEETKKDDPKLKDSILNANIVELSHDTKEQLKQFRKIGILRNDVLRTILRARS
jgi:hypothetical protein